MKFPKLSQRAWSWICSVGLALVISAVGIATRSQWLPAAKELFTSTPSSDGDSSQEEDEHAGHNHAGHSESESLELSENARRNIGLETDQVKLRPFERTVGVPAMVVERPGRSHIDITAPFTAVVTRIYPIQGEALKPGQPLFDLRLTHEDLVDAQREFLLASEQLTVVKLEVDRLSKIIRDIEGRRLTEQEYERRKIEATLRARREGLLLHGLSEEQVDQILASGKLLRTLTVVAPPFSEEPTHKDFEHLYHVQALAVNPGQQVTAGERLAVLADHCDLYIEGKAFEDDAERLTQAANEGWPVDAVMMVEGKRLGDPLRLKILYVSDQVEADSRSLHFYMKLPNDIVRDSRQDGHRFIGWKYRPGQRLEVRVPVERWEKQIVLPIDAVAEEGAETFVFEQNEDHFDRVSVHVRYRDKNWVVIDDDGSLVGSTVAVSGAYQMQLALKNKAGGGIDPHAGHNH